MPRNVRERVAEGDARREAWGRRVGGEKGGRI